MLYCIVINNDIISVGCLYLYLLKIENWYLSRSDSKNNQHQSCTMY